MKRTEEKELLNRLKSIQEKHKNRPRPILIRYEDGHEERTIEYAHQNGILSTRYIEVENYTEWLIVFDRKNQFRHKDPSELVTAIVYLDSGETNNIKEQARYAAEHPLTEEDIAEIMQEIEQYTIKKGRK